MGYTRESIDRVREAASIELVVARKTTLRRAGAELKGLCPFHEERTPSFSVDAEQNLYHCFGCGVGGDAIRFVMETEGLDFQAAVEDLAERFSVKLVAEHDDLAAAKRRRLYALLHRVTEFYDSYLWKSEEAADARRYLRERGFSKEILKQFRIGYAPNEPKRVTTSATESGFMLQELIDTGVSVASHNGFIGDRFRGRIMFPLMDEKGRPLGFGARDILDQGEPKYINTTNTVIYEKGRHLYGMDAARSRAIEDDQVVVVEGYTDVLALHQGDVRNSVAAMGTALTEEQLGKLSRIATTIVLALDPDKAGQMASERMTLQAQNRGINIATVDIPPGVDPAELIMREGAEAFRERLQQARLLANSERETPEPEQITADPQLRQMLTDLDEIQEEIRKAGESGNQNLLGVLKQMREKLRHDIAKRTGDG